jgi:hypothetical protein
VKEWFAGDRYETLAICRRLALARVVFAVAIEADIRPIRYEQPVRVMPR